MLHGEHFVNIASYNSHYREMAAVSDVILSSLCSSVHPTSATKLPRDKLEETIPYLKVFLEPTCA